VAERAIIVGASAAGLAVGACLKQHGVPFVMLEQRAHVAHAWRNHYARLHLHTPRGGSSLPGLPMPSSYPRYPSGRQVVDYLEAYRAHFELAPKFGRTVTAITRQGDAWLVDAGEERFSAANVVVATGYTHTPNRPIWPGEEHCKATILHSAQYATGAAYRGQRVLVVGFGNSAGEIAIDLVEQGAEVTISVRDAVNVIPRDLFGLPILSVGIAMSALAPKVADAMSAPLIRWALGDIRKLGLRKLPYGPIEQIRTTRRIPLLDIGTLALIRSGKLEVAPGVERFTQDGVVFSDGRTQPFDTVVLATGYRPELETFLRSAGDVLGDDGVPRKSGAVTLHGLYFCGFHVAPTGMLREIGIEARRIAAAIAAV
jgi:cation diffusion facilitator CzcD-associated flavoprotein CzcO